MLLSLAELCEIRTGYQFRKGVGDEVASAEPVGVIQLRDIKNGKANFAALEHARIKTPEKYLVQSGDVLFLARGQRFTATPLAQVPPGVIATHFFLILRPRQPELLSSEYLAWWLNHPATQDALKGVARQTHIPFVSTSEVRSLEMPVPLPATQIQILELANGAQREADLTTQLLRKREQLVNELTLQLASGQLESPQTHDNSTLTHRRPRSRAIYLRDDD